MRDRNRRVVPCASCIGLRIALSFLDDSNAELFADQPRQPPERAPARPDHCSAERDGRAVTLRGPLWPGFFGLAANPCASKFPWPVVGWSGNSLPSKPQSPMRCRDTRRSSRTCLHCVVRIENSLPEPLMRNLLGVGLSVPSSRRASFLALAVRASPHCRLRACKRQLNVTIFTPPNGATVKTLPAIKPAEFGG